LRATPAEGGGNPLGFGILLSLVLAMTTLAPPTAGCQQPASSPASQLPIAQFTPWEGLIVRRISYEGIPDDRLGKVTSQLAQQEGKPLRQEDLHTSLRQLYASGLYETIEVQAAKLDDGVALIFTGMARTFVGTVSVDGAKGATINAQLQRASQLTTGTRYTSAKLAHALDEMRTTLAANGFHEPVITETLTPRASEQLVDIVFHVVSGPQARVGSVDVSGDPGIGTQEFRHHAHLRSGARVDHDTANRALDGVLKHYQKEERLEADVKLESEQYAAATKREDFHFSANQGPVVKVIVEGAKMSGERIKHVIPIFEEGTVDEDLLNEGSRRLRDFYQRLGYFDVKVDHEQQNTGAHQVSIVYNVHLGTRRRVLHVEVTGNHYFDSATLQELLSVHAADTLDRNGAYSQALVSADVNAIQAVYQNNGFSKVKVIPETSTPGVGLEEVHVQDNVDAPSRTTASARPRTAPLTVIYRIQEGQQLRVGSVNIDGAAGTDAGRLATLLNTSPGQLLSPQNLAGDRDSLLTDYLSRGFDQAHIDITQNFETADAGKVDVVFHVTEGQQIFVRKVLVTGLHYTRPETVAKAITLHPGDPLNQSALMQTQRNLYEFALFNEVDTAVENPNGEELDKTVLIQAIEARRWALTYGFGFEAQTGQPQNNCKGDNTDGIPCNPNGKTGVSPRVLLDLTRNGLFGREQSASVRGTYGLLEQKIDLLFQIPHFEDNHDFALSVSGGYANSQDVTTYVASRLEAGVRLTQHFSAPGALLSKANTFEYEYNFRRVKVAQDSLQVGPFALVELSTASRVAGPTLTWVRDTRDSPLDAHRGTSTSLQEFLSAKPFGAVAQFNRLDVSNSSFYSFDKGRLVVARNTRYGQERSFGNAAGELLPLPERLFAGGANSLRGFSINAAGPRDPETGYPIGGAGVLTNSTELRLPPPTLPWVGNTVSFVLFHDMGNVFTNAGDAWTSLARIHQPDRSACETPIAVTVPPTSPPGPNTSTGLQGTCSFNYFSHAPGLGVRYHTPVGPIRLDFSYNLNPPIYPVTYNYSLPDPGSNPHVGQASHFNFFFSLGESF
jgi:outer membrane protein insertion porin family